MTDLASATVLAPSGAVVHLVGVNHCCAYSGRLAHDAISGIKPDAVVLEVDEARLREQAERAALWLEHGRRTQIVAAAVRPFLREAPPPRPSPPAPPAARHRHAYMLANEGSALLEGAVYGSEVVLACQAASATGAEIVLADRAKALSRARLQAAHEQARLAAMAALPDDDWSLLCASMQAAVRSLGRRLHAALAPAFASDGALFGRGLHPLFEVADAPAGMDALEAAGCRNGPAVVAALRRLMAAGSRKDAEISPSDLRTVQACIAQVEARKHRCRQAVYAACQSAPAQSQSCGAAASADGQAGAAAPPELLELAHRLDAVQPANALAGTDDGPGVAHLLRAAASAARRALGLGGDAAGAASTFERWCSRGAGHMHSFALAAHTPGAHAARAARRADAEAYYRTTVAERDSILAARIWRVAAEPGAKSIVAVVGANHVPGILRNWHAAGTAAAQAEAQRCLAPPAPPSGEDASARWKAAVVHDGARVLEAAAVGAALYLPYRAAAAISPRAARWLPLGLAAGAVLLAGAAARQQERVARLVHNIAAAQDRIDAAERARV